MSALNMIPILAPQVVSRLVDEVMIILLPEIGEVKVLNEVGARVFQLVDGFTSVAEIAAKIAAEYQVSAEQAERDTLEFLRELQTSRALTIKVAGELNSMKG